ncbi:MAG: cysteine hydrolase family protein [Terriglobia bacterium]
MVQSRFHRGMLVAAAAALLWAMLPVVASAQGVVGEWKTVEPPPAPELKTVEVDPHTTALLVMDFLEVSCAPGSQHARPRCVRAIPKVKQLLDEARAQHMLVIFTGFPQRSPIVKALTPMQGEPLLVAHADKFHGTDLDKILKDHGITAVIATGTSANGAVLFTAFGAAIRGYKVIVPVDTMPGANAYAEQSSIWGIAHDPSLGTMSTLTSVDIIKF